jgi:hypothetical protein
MALDPTALLLLIAGPVFVLELILIVRRFPIFGAGLFLTTAILSSFSWPPGITVLGYQVYALDVAALVLFGASLLALSDRRRVSRWLWALAALATLALARGLVEYGSQSAVNASRELFYLMAALLFSQICLSDKSWPRLQILWIISGGVLILTALLFFAQHGFGTYGSSGTRALNPPQTLLVAQAGLIALTLGGRQRRLFALLSFLVVVACQQRTVWAATLAAAVVIAFQVQTDQGQKVSRTIRRSILTGLTAIIALLMFGPSGLQSSVSSATSEASVDSGTFGWRIKGWLELLQQYSKKSGVDQIVGQPAGHGFARGDFGVLTVSPHNMYITAIVSLGAVGLLAYIALVVSAITQSKYEVGPLRAIVASLVVFSIGYQLPPEQGLALGAAMALAAPKVLAKQRPAFV